MEGELKKTVVEVYSIAEDVKIKVVLVGALVAQFSRDAGPDYPRFRGTNDADFAVSVRNWDSYKRLYDELLDRGYKPHSKIEHRLLRGSMIVDLIPYGAEIAPNGKLLWPESGKAMTVTGFDEVCAAAQAAVGQDNPAVPVITAPGFVLLKMVSFLDREEQRHPKYSDDARDVAYWLRNYASGAGDDRRYELAGGKALMHEDYETAGAVLVGVEVGKLASPGAAAYLERFLTESSNKYSRFMDALAAGQFEEEGNKRRQEGLSLLEAFAKGYRFVRAKS